MVSASSSNLYYVQGDIGRAMEHYEIALTIGENVLGKTHPETTKTYNNIGNVYQDQGDYEKALEYYEKALTIIENVLEPDHPDVWV